MICCDEGGDEMQWSPASQSVVERMGRGLAKLTRVGTWSAGGGGELTRETTA